MILQALKEYYDRKAADPDSGIAPLGWERKEIPFLIVLTKDGSLVRVEDTQEMVGKKKRARPFLVPQSVKRSSGVAANLLWDNVEYVTGVVCKGKSDRVAAQHADFLSRLAPLSDCPSVDAVLAFLKSPNFRDCLAEQSAWKEAVEVCAFVSFQIAGHDTPVFREPDVIARIDALAVDSEADGICLVSGERDAIAELHPAVKGVLGTNTTGGNIVSFNFPAASSFGKTQGLNAPVGKRAAFQYTTALNTLLGKDSRQKMQVGDATTVFWSSEKSVLEDEFADIFGEPQKDSPDRGVDAVERLLSSVRTGAYAHEAGTARFYVLGLSPNTARIAVRFWHEGTVAEMEKCFADWFESLLIDHGPGKKEHLSLTELLLSIAPHNKDYQKWKANIPPNLAAAVMRSILDGTPLPASLLPAAIVRIKAERDIPYPRAKLIKAFLNRNHERKLTMSLDKDNPDIGYRLGRLFAVLERIQQVAINPTATIRDRFYASASATPAAVFGNLMRLAGHHLSKLDSDKKGLRVWLERQLEEIMSGIPKFPAHLSLEEQGMFAIGYYHQRCAKKSDSTGDATPAAETV